MPIYGFRTMDQYVVNRGTPDVLATLLDGDYADIDEFEPTNLWVAAINLIDHNTDQMAWEAEMVSKWAGVPFEDDSE